MSDKTVNLIIYVVLSALALAMIFPFLWMFFSSLKSMAEIYQMTFLPQSPTLHNYEYVFAFSLFPRWFLNSLIVALVTTVSVIFFDSLTGYTLAKYDFPGKNVIFILILSTLMIPTEMLVIPWYTMSRQLNWLDTYWGIMFPGMTSAFGIFLMRQFIKGVPDDLIDAARIDGMSEFGIFVKVVMPLVRPAIATLAIFNFIGNWNAFLWPLIVSSTSDMYTLPVGLAYFSSENLMQWELVMTGASVSIMPLIVFFVIFQRYIVKGIALTGLKG